MRFLVSFVFVLGGFWGPLATAECSLRYTYDTADRLGPAFFARAGYSRDNDDVLEGHFETAVLDFELVGFPDPKGQGTCLYLVSTSVLMQEAQSAAGWVNAWFARPAGTVSVLASGRVPKTAPLASAAPSKVLKEQIASYMQNGMPDTKMPAALVRGEDRGPSVSLRTETLLGRFGDGKHGGRVYFQKAGRLDAKGNGLFLTQDDSSYDLVRHVLEWRVELQSGMPVNIERPLLDPRTKSESGDFANQVKLLTPSWHGVAEVPIPSQPGKMEIKKHSVALLWRDVLVKSENRNPAYGKTDLYQLLSKTSSTEVMGKRFPHKSNRYFDPGAIKEPSPAKAPSQKAPAPQAPPRRGRRF
jgi:hypothetical protein